MKTYLHGMRVGYALATGRTEWTGLSEYDRSVYLVYDEHERHGMVDEVMGKE